MDLGLKGRVAVVTGGSRGIGYAAAQQFLLEGAKVAICARGEQALKSAAEALSELGDVYYESVDLSDAGQVYAFAKNVFDHFGALDCWVNNAGAVGYKKGVEYDEEEIDFMVGINFKAIIYGCQAAFRYMQNTGGAIVNVSSLAARCASVGRSTLYGPLKSAINNLTNMFAGEYCAHNVRVTGIMPGLTGTDMTEQEIGAKQAQKLKQQNLLHRMADPSEQARPIVFLASSAASYMTATTIEVTAGWSATLNPTYAWDKYGAHEAE
ncbi:MAG: SDR family NAD(P)-dependent oxidoreductase [Christensenellales bacterium]